MPFSKRRKGFDRMEITIARGGFSAAASTAGAELMHLRFDGKEYLWGGDPAWWANRAPILFPMVGSLRKDTAATKSGGICRMKRHGLAKFAEHSVYDKGDDFVTFRLESSPWSLQQYPYAFCLDTTYRITGPKTLETRFTVQNTGDIPMPWLAGGHPAFHVPSPEGADDAFEDYVLCFPDDKPKRVPVLLPNGEYDFSDLLTLPTVGNELPLTHKLFDNDALAFSDLSAPTLTLRSKKTGHGIRIDFADFPMIGVWSKAGAAPFVALEPWMGCTTSKGESDCFDEKRGMEVLAPGGCATRAFAVTVL